LQNVSNLRKQFLIFQVFLFKISSKVFFRCQLKKIKFNEKKLTYDLIMMLLMIVNNRLENKGKILIKFIYYIT